MKMIVMTADKLKEELAGVSINQILCGLDCLYSEQKKSLGKFEKYLKDHADSLGHSLLETHLTQV